MDNKQKDLQCSFCLKKHDEVEMIISGAKAHICDECITNASKIIKQELGLFLDDENGESKIRKATKTTFDFKPLDIKNHLDNYVIGQDDAKKVISVAIYNHYKRLNQEVTDDEVEIEKSNIIMTGETGTGKTLLAKTVAKLLNVPFAIVDATVFTQAGYVGEDVESILSRLLQNADYDVSQAERGIIYIDEIDKIGRKSDNPSITRDVSGEGVQQAMLKLLEGTDVLVPPQGGRKHPEQKMVKVNTQNILFICGGAFEGIDKVIGRRVQTATIGFKNSDLNEIKEEELIQHVNAQDLRSFGLIPELLGRLPVVTYLMPLDKSALKRILTEPRNALVKQYQKLMEYENASIEFTDDGIDYIVQKAIDFKLGGRGLRSICEVIMTDAMFDIPSRKGKKKLIIDEKYAREHIEKSKLAYLKVA